MKRTTDGRWAHLACAIWIPGFFLSFPINYSDWLTQLVLLQKLAYLILRKWSLLME